MGTQRTVWDYVYRMLEDEASRDIGTLDKDNLPFVVPDVLIMLSSSETAPRLDDWCATFS